MNLKEKTIEGLKFCNDPETPCKGCPYEDCKWNDDRGDCLWRMADDALKIIKAYDFAWEQLKETVEELIENNGGDIRRVCILLLNLMKIKEADIREGFYLESTVSKGD
jgi:hypothetical protein